MKQPQTNVAGANGNKRRYLLLRVADYSKRYAAMFAVAFGAIGGVILLNSGSASHPTPALYLTPDTKKLEAGDTVTVHIREDSGKTPVNGVSVNLRYPSNLLECAAVPDGTKSAFTIDVEQERSRETQADPLTTSCPAGQGKVIINRGSISGLTGDQLVASVTFRVKAESGKALLAFAEGTQLSGVDGTSNILGSLHATYGAAFNIGDGGESGTSSSSSSTTQAVNDATATTALTPHPVPSVYISPASREAAQGTTVTVQVRADSGNTPVNGVAVSLKYPADLLECVSPPDGANSGFIIDVERERHRNDQAQWLQSTCPTGKGVVTFNRGSVSGVTGDQLVAMVSFKVKSSVGKATLAFVDGTQLNGVSTTRSILPSLKSTVGSSLNLGVLKRGDVNKDGAVNDKDVAVLKLHWGTNNTDADLDKNGTVDLTDLSIVMASFPQ